MSYYYNLSYKECLAKLKSSKRGLSEKEAKARLQQYGENKIAVSKPISPLKILIKQFKSFLVIVLIIAALVSLVMGFLPGREMEYESSVLILLIVLFNGLFGFLQDFKAEKSIEALKKISVKHAKILREGTVILIKPKELVPGDIVLLEAGEQVPADLRIIEESELSIDESILSGESRPASKTAKPIPNTVALADRKNMAYMNTIITRGTGKGLVVTTANNTEVGKIADEIFSSPSRETPFTKELDTLGKRLGYIILGLILIIAISQFAMDNLDPILIFMIAISLGVAAIPEGLPAVVTLAMAFGTKKMLKQNALVRKLSVVESLGAVDIICTDKTGTITENRMTVKKIFYKSNFYEVTGAGYDEKGEFKLNEEIVDVDEIKPVLEAGLHCNDATLGKDNEGNSAYIGDPTEIALLVAGHKANLKSIYKRVYELPFSEDKKMMVTVHKVDGKLIAFMKGAPEVVLQNSRCSLKQKEIILKANNSMAKKALRVLGFAQKELSKNFKRDELEGNYSFIGLQGMIDPPRDNVRQAIKECLEAGIRVKMATGDNLITAKAIASEVGIGINAINGAELDKHKGMALVNLIEKTDIFARVSPQHKVLILKVLQSQGHIVAMTGDGVNDAPALKNSDVGIGMGIRGADLSKEVSDMVLLDDNFTTIKNAIKEGRTTFENIRKFVNYLLTSNIAEVFVVFIISLFGKLALVPAQLLWINLLTDGLPALALGIDPSLPDIMKQKPKNKKEGILNKKLMTLIIVIGSLLTALIVPIFFVGLKKSLIMAQTMLFTSLVIFEMLRLAVIRSSEKLSLFSNKWLILAVGFSIGLQLLVLYTPLSKFFGVIPLGWFEWGIILGFGTLGYLLSLILTKHIFSKI